MGLIGKIREIGQKFNNHFSGAARPEVRDEIENYPEAEAVRLKTIRMFTPLVDKLNQTIPADEEGRTYRLLVQKEMGVFGDAPEVKARIGHFNDREAKSMAFFMGKGGWDTVSPDGITYVDVSNRSYNFSLPVETNGKKQLFVGYAPVEKDSDDELFKSGNDNSLTIHKRFTRTNADKLCQGMMATLDIAENSRFQIMDWRDLRDAIPAAAPKIAVAATAKAFEL